MFWGNTTLKQVQFCFCISTESYILYFLAGFILCLLSGGLVFVIEGISFGDFRLLTDYACIYWASFGGIIFSISFRHFGFKSCISLGWYGGFNWASDVRDVVIFIGLSWDGVWFGLILLTLANIHPMTAKRQTIFIPSPLSFSKRDMPGCWLSWHVQLFSCSVYISCFLKFGNTTLNTKLRNT